MSGFSKADLVIGPINWLAALLIGWFGQGTAMAVIGGLGGSISALLLFSMLPRSSRTKAEPEVRPADPQPIDDVAASDRLSRRINRIRLGSESPAAAPEPTPAPTPAPAPAPAPTSHAGILSTQPKPSGEINRALSEYLAASLYGADNFTYAAAIEATRRVNGADAELSPQQFEHARQLWQDQRDRTTPHGEKIRPVLLARKARRRGENWFAEPSHFGGLPRLGQASWPRGKNGTPLPFVAQIDLAQLAAQCPESPLPHTGSLAFFINDGAVIHVPDGVSEHTPAPADLPHAFEEGGYPLPERPSPVTQQLFPFWPLELFGVSLPDDLPDADGDFDNLDEIWNAQNEAFNARLAPPKQGSPLHPGYGIKEDYSRPLWWYGAQHVARRLHQALDEHDRVIAQAEDSIAKSAEWRAKLQAQKGDDPQREARIAATFTSQDSARKRIEQARNEAQGLAQFIPHFDQFVSGRAPWQAMLADEMGVLEEAMAEARQTFPALCEYKLPRSLEELRGICFRRMITGDETAFAQLPEDVLDAINGDLRPGNSAQHQIFGLGTNIQTALDDHLSHLLLFQLGYDDLPEMRFGDVGAWQFWIRPEDARAGRWDQVELTFECH